MNGTATERLVQGIADAIFSGEFAAGSRLDEQQLAQRFAVSRTPVREALRQLGATGLIEVRPRRGAFVAKVSARQLEDMFVALGELEAACARLAALSMSPIERRRLRALHDAMDELARMGDALRFGEANDELHAMIRVGAHNVVLADMAAGMRCRLASCRAPFLPEPRPLRSQAEHGAVIRAIVKGDARGAHEAMLNHVTLIESFEELFANRALGPVPAEVQ